MRPHDAFGNLTSVTDPLGNVIANAYDLRGRKISSADPDMGSWSYVNRLTNSATGNAATACTSSGTGIATKTVSYDSGGIGNIRAT